MTNDKQKESSLSKRIICTILFIFFFIKELLVSSVRVAIDVMRPSLKFVPGVIAFPLCAKSDLEITLLANVISLTPGTLSLDVSSDRRVLYIHAMYAEDPEKIRIEIRNGLEKRLLEALR